MKSIKKFLFIVTIALLALLVYAAGFGNKRTHSRSPQAIGENPYAHKQY